MIEVESAQLKDSVGRIGLAQFVSAEWWPESPRFVLLRYRLQGQGRLEEKGLRLDLDKKAIIDDVPDRETDQLVKQRARSIWEAVVAAYDRPARGPLAH